MRLTFNRKNKDIFDFLKTGEKSIETRAASIKYKYIQPGEVILFSCAGETFERKVRNVIHFSSVESLLSIYSPEVINPHLHTKEEVIAMYESFPGYKEKIEQFGLIALEFE